MIVISTERSLSGKIECCPRLYLYVIKNKPQIGFWQAQYRYQFDRSLARFSPSLKLVYYYVCLLINLGLVANVTHQRGIDKERFPSKFPKSVGVLGRIHFWHERRRCSRSPSGGRLATTLVDRYFHHYFFSIPFSIFFPFSVATFSHRRSARIKKLI